MYFSCSLLLVLCCVSTLMFVEVRSQCRPVTERVQVCENGGDLNINCCEGTIVINSANYGRTQPDNAVCPYGRPHNDRTDCVDPTAYAKIRSACQGQHSCTVPVTNARFGDPCYGTYKYLDASYTCQCPECSTDTKRVQVCENAGDLNMDCGVGTIVINSANYGRTQPDNAMCPYGRYHQDRTDCVDATSHATIRSACEGQHSCTVPATNAHFGDPCYGTYKYLDASYTCQCPVNGGYSAWTSWSTCTATCGPGVISRTRACNSPAPSNGGSNCVSPSVERLACNVASCSAFGEYYTDWFNHDHPSGNTDTERIEEHRWRYGDFAVCNGVDEVVSAECRVKNGNGALYPNITPRNTLRVPWTCSISGLFCWNDASNTCLDYEVRYKCRQRSLPANTRYTTAWFDHPSSSLTFTNPRWKPGTNNNPCRGNDQVVNVECRLGTSSSSPLCGSTNIECWRFPCPFYRVRYTCMAI